jgi:hypothetical protein
MNKSILSVVFFPLTISIINAQELQFSPFAGYTFADKFGFYRGSAKIGDEFTYGGVKYFLFDIIGV